MRNGLALSLLVGFPVCALAQSPDLEATCQSVARGFFMTDKRPVGTIRSFPELKPPGVRMTCFAREGVAVPDMTDTLCEFGKTNKPHHLVGFCVSSTCYSPNEADGDRNGHFDEARILLDLSEKQ
ncbi:hypothetical protein [Rhizobium sp. BK661]|uniref:hypothetical protein n=1 Tax=Rhizobium sp. BK661 TaxID=2586991 RepID=UPI002166DAE2|nr:hypothetical protein [Rhizobium sp. BK661]MCS3742105.1 hypothetical protein [Rhizobium sp. BK661]